MCGGRAIVELMYADFIGCAGDEIFNQLAKWQAMSPPVSSRCRSSSAFPSAPSTAHSILRTGRRSTAHIPGLKVVFPATPYDAKGLMTSALDGTDPVVFFESQRIYGIGEQFLPDGVPTGHYEVRLGDPDIKKPG